MEPSFKYITNPEKGNQDSVNVNEKTVGEQNKEAEVIQKKESKKHGSSLGWGWFQGFNIFITGCFLAICIVIAYFMMGSDSTHSGPPKYTIDRSSDLGKAIFNPNIPEEIRESFIYHPPVRRPKNEDKPILDEIQLISESSKQADTPTTSDLPVLTLISSVDEETEVDSNFYGDEPFGLTLESLQRGSTETNSNVPVSSDNPEVQQLLTSANIAAERGQLSEPYQGSALSFYHSALEIAPSDPAVLTAIDQLAQRYLTLAQENYNRGDLFSALDYTDLGLKVDPLNPELNQLKAFLINE